MTNLTLPSLHAEVQNNRGECDRRHERSAGEMRRVKDTQIKHDRKLISISGLDGRNGKLGDHEKRLTKIEGIITRVLLAAAAGGFVGAGVVYGVAQMVGGAP